MGGPKYDKLDFSVKPERGLLRLRKEMDLFSNLRPAQCFDALADFSSLKKDVVSGLDIVIVRELTSGVYFGEPRGIFKEGNERVGINTQRYTESEIARVAKSAFELARKRNNKVCSMEKANVMESGILWREVVQEVHDREYPDVQLTHMYADNGDMQLCRWPKQFDVIVTDNLFGDMLSDVAAMLTGSLGMLPSASLDIPALTVKDREDVRFALEHQVDWIALSFVRSDVEVLELKSIVKERATFGPVSYTHLTLPTSDLV